MAPPISITLITLETQENYTRLITNNQNVAFIPIKLITEQLYYIRLKPKYGWKLSENRRIQNILTKTKLIGFINKLPSTQSLAAKLPFDL